MKAKKLSLLAAAGIALVVSFTTITPAYGADPDVSASTQPDDVLASLPDTTLSLVPFVDPVSVADAMAYVGTLRGATVESLRIDNGDVVGEYAINGPISVPDLLTWFDKKYQTQPEVVGFNVRRSVEDLQREGSPAAVRAGERFDAGPATFEPPAPAPEAGPSSPERILSGDWRPKDAYFAVVQPSSTVAEFQHNYSWASGDDPGQTPWGFGLEFEHNLYNTTSGITGLRGSCSINGVPDPNYKDRFWAKNYSWTWFAQDGTSTFSFTQPYADYNDLLDDCTRNSIAIGLRYPQYIAPYYGYYGLTLNVLAPRGLYSSSVIGAVIQKVSDDFCNTILGSTYSLTDCMGVYPGIWPSGVPDYRMVLNSASGHTVPNYCWSSGNYGTTAAATEVC